MDSVVTKKQICYGTILPITNIAKLKHVTNVWYSATVQNVLKILTPWVTAKIANFVCISNSIWCQYLDQQHSLKSVLAKHAPFTLENM